MKRAAIVLLALFAVVLAGCETKDPDSKKFVVATDATYQPMEFYNDKHETRSSVSTWI